MNFCGTIDSDNIAFSVLYGTRLLRVYGQNRGEGYREEGLSVPLKDRMYIRGRLHSADRKRVETRPNDGHDTRAIQHYLGHKNIQHTVRYTVLRADRFKHFWTD